MVLITGRGSVSGNLKTNRTQNVLPLVIVFNYLFGGPGKTEEIKILVGVFCPWRWGVLGDKTPHHFLAGVLCPPKHPNLKNWGVLGIKVGVFLTWGVMGGHRLCQTLLTVRSVHWIWIYWFYL